MFLCKTTLPLYLMLLADTDIPWKIPTFYHFGRLGSLALKPEDSTVLLFEADTSALRQTITTFGSLKTIQIPEHLMAHASSSSIGPFLEKRGYIQVPEQKSASSGTAVSLSEWLLVSKPAIGLQAPYVPSTNPQDWLIPKQTSENSQVCSCLYCFWGRLG